MFYPEAVIVAKRSRVTPSGFETPPLHDRSSASITHQLSKRGAHLVQFGLKLRHPLHLHIQLTINVLDLVVDLS
jgi:hypothetical protein